LAYAAARNIPVVFDPLISSYDKVVFERRKSDADCPESRRLLRWESELFNSATVLVADTTEHATFFAECHQVRPENIVVVPVGAEEQLFQPQPFPVRWSGQPTALFYGSFIGLQGAEFIAAAAGHAPEVNWVLLGDGPARKACEAIARDSRNLHLMDPVPYETLPEVIGRAEILLGVFGTSDKAGRVIPNKVYQSMACGRCVITRESEAYPESVIKSSSESTGVIFVPPGDPAALASAVAQLAQDRDRYQALGQMARRTFDAYFGKTAVDAGLMTVLKRALGVSQVRRAA
jgi:glycosyltransferase involved in cell wall biosynthesis